MCSMDFSFPVGQTLIIQLTTTEIIEGEYASGGKDRIDMVNVKDYDTRNTLGDTLFMFYRNEISSIHQLESQTKESEESENQDNKFITLAPCEYQRLKALTESYVYMATMDSRYMEAMEHLRQCESVAVVGLGNNRGIASSLDLLVVGTWDKVYIFDMLLFNKKILPKELKYILQTTEIKKVVHDSCNLVNRLYSGYKEKIVNLFDTQVADVMLQEKQSPLEKVVSRNLGECLTQYFNFPNNLLKRAKLIDGQKWRERPLTDGKKIMAAQMVVYLINLRNHLERLMLQDFYARVEKCSENTIRQMSGTHELAESFNSVSVSSSTSGWRPEET